MHSSSMIRIAVLLISSLQQIFRLAGTGNECQCHAFLVIPSWSSSPITRRRRRQQQHHLQPQLFYSRRSSNPIYYWKSSSSSPISKIATATAITTTRSKTPSSSSSSTTALRNGIILDVDDNFFTYAFFSIGLFYSLGKAYNRYVLEEIAFEQRKLEARRRILDQDPTVDEFTLRRMESAKWSSAYGRKKYGGGSSRGDEDEDVDRTRRKERSGKSRRVATVMDYDDDDDDDEFDDDENEESSSPNTNTRMMMSSDEISDFESQYNIPYDPYYDEPYTEDQLPQNMKYKVDKSYGDRRYENGEVFYKEEGTGYYYRMGSRPRQKKFWDWGGMGTKK